jgi:hypothetical protein
MTGACVWLALAQEKGDEDIFDGKGSPDVDTEWVHRLVRVQVEFVEVPNEVLTDLLLEFPQPTCDSTPLRRKLHEMAGKGEAKVIDTLMVTARGGEKATVESIDEFIYPTEYEPMEIPTNVPEPQRDSDVLRSMETFTVPTSFETRHLGSTLEIAVDVDESGRFVELNYAPELVWHTGETLWCKHTDSLGNDSLVQMPRIYNISVNSALDCISGQNTLVAVTSPKDEEGKVDRSRKVLVFVKCDVMDVK